MKVTIFGASGLLGKALMREWREDRVTGLSSKDADVRDPRQVKDAVEGTHPDWIVLAAAYTDVDGCETNRERAFAVNRDGAANVARAAKEHGSRLLFLSTDYVFDGSKITPYEVGDPRAPQSVYGRSKAEAEMRLENILPNCCIVRTSWLFGPGGKCFPDTILKLASTRAEIDVVNDQRGSPTYTLDLADAIAKVCRSNARGIIHGTNRGDCSWYEFASEIIQQGGLKTIVRPTTSDRFVRPAERPQYSVLSNASLSGYGIEMRPWQETVPDYLRERAASPSG